MRTDEKQGWTWERGWPCQRLRLGWAMILFFFFEVLIGKQLPEVMPFMILGVGLSLLVSAMMAIREWKLEAQLHMIQEALDHSFGR